jgi:hypothetical protein
MNWFKRLNRDQQESVIAVIVGLLFALPISWFYLYNYTNIQNCPPMSPDKILVGLPVVSSDLPKSAAVITLEDRSGTIVFESCRNIPRGWYQLNGYNLSAEDMATITQALPCQATLYPNLRTIGRSVMVSGYYWQCQ